MSEVKTRGRQRGDKQKVVSYDGELYRFSKNGWLKFCLSMALGDLSNVNEELTKWGKVIDQPIPDKALEDMEKTDYFFECRNQIMGDD